MALLGERDGGLVQRNTRSRARGRFGEFAARAEPKLRQALVARFGPTVGRDAAVDALAYGWEHWSKLEGMSNPAGYLYKVGVSTAKRAFSNKTPIPPGSLETHEPWVEPALPQALTLLSDRQRTAVVLVYSFEWTHLEVAGLLGLSTSSVQKHVERGLAKLRVALEVGNVA